MRVGAEPSDFSAFRLGTDAGPEGLSDLAFSHPLQALDGG